MNHQLNITSNQPIGSKGFTLIELLITTVISVIILAGVIAIGTKVLIVNSAVLKSAKLNQNLGAALQVMVDDIRRAGYELDPDDPLLCPAPACTYKSEREDINIVSNSCILYSYDRDDDDAVDDNERYGFKLNGGQVEIRRSCTPGDATDPTVSPNCVSDCTTGTWEFLSDDAARNEISITSLTFSSTGSKCQEITHDDPAEPKPRLGKNGNYWITDGDTTTSFPCTATTSANLIIYALDAGDVYQTTDVFEAPTAGGDPPLTSDRTTEIRQVNIALEGKVKRPSQFDATASRKKLEVSIKVRNDRIRKHSL